MAIDHYRWVRNRARKMRRDLPRPNTISFDLFQNIHYFEQGRWTLLPEWARFFLEIGYAVGSLTSQEFPIVTAVSVPTRAFAVALTAAGVILAKSINAGDEADEHLQRILALEIGTPVKLRVQKKIKKGIYLGCRNALGKRKLVIKIEKGTEQWIPVEQANRIEAFNQDSIRLPNRQKGRDIIPPSPLIGELLGKIGAFDFVSQTRLDCCLLGPINVLKNEITEARFSFQSEETHYPGVLQDILRVRRFLKQGIGSHSTAVSPASQRNSDIANLISPDFVLFDGSTGFLKWRHLWKNSGWFVILDRTDRYFEYALDQINQEYFRTHVEQFAPLKVTVIPDGIDVMAFGAHR